MSTQPAQLALVEDHWERLGDSALPSTDCPPSLEASVREHFELLYVPGYSLALGAIDSLTKAVEHRFTSDADEAVAFVRRWNGKRNLYLTLNLFPERHRGGRTRYDVAGLQGVHLDLDPDSSNLSPPADVCLSTLGGVLEAVSRVFEISRKSVVTLYSGRGAQAVVLGTPHALQTKADQDAANEGGKTFLQMLSSDEYVRGLLYVTGFKLDATGDLPRLMRLAGTVNLKTGNTAYLESPTEQPTRCETLGVQLIALGQPKVPASQARIAMGEGVPPPLPGWARDLLQRDPTLRGMWQADWTSADRSKAEFEIAARFCRAARKVGRPVDRGLLAAVVWEKPHGKAQNPNGRAAR